MIGGSAGFRFIDDGIDETESGQQGKRVVITRFGGDFGGMVQVPDLGMTVTAPVAARPGTSYTCPEATSRRRISIQTSESLALGGHGGASG